MTDKIRARELAPFDCSAGLKEFCAANGWSYMTLLKEGYSVEDFLATGDIQAHRVVKQVLAAREARLNE